MPADPDTNTELDEARALAKATLVALDRFGLQLSYDELKRLVASLDQANELLAQYDAERQPPDLMAAMMTIDQARRLLVQQARSFRGV